VNALLWAAVGMLVAMSPCLVLLAQADPMAALVAYEVLSSVAVMVLVLVADGLGRSGELELPVLLAVLLFGSGMVFVRALERWL
jgi:multidrug transporter EmrE-like cation transporter